ncbi:MAG: transporter substrate-binding domain-containing protein, partial [Alphaproteobacteria bacterium]|nr:transporter substrate-binding domain-containing protein [Alphaproteobacteria bacterium]
PYNFTDPRTGTATGIAVEAMRAALRRAGIAAEIRMLPWHRAYRMAQAQADACVFAVNRSPEREALFKWAGPLLTRAGGTALLGLPTFPGTLAHVEDARRHAVGAQEGSAVERQLRAVPGIRLTTFTDAKAGARLLAAGRIELWAGGILGGAYVARQEGIGPLKVVLVMHRAELYAACNRAVPDGRMESLNAALRQLRDDGTTAAIEARYLGAPGTADAAAAPAVDKASARP